MSTAYEMPLPRHVVRRMQRMAMASPKRGRRGRRGGGHEHGHEFPMGGPGPFFRGRPKVSRGDVRAAILSLLAEEPMHGYQIMQELSERTGGIWRPSPGSVYPTLQQLQDEGLVTAETHEGKKVYDLTDAGRDAVADGAPPWESLGVDRDLMELRDLAFQVGAAVMQVAHAGTGRQMSAAKDILKETRSRLYGLLAESEETTDEG